MGKDPKHKHFNNKRGKHPYNKDNWKTQREHRKPKGNFSQHKNNNSQTPNIPKVTLREDQVGITQFTSDSTLGFTGILKSRFSDFHVNEIDTNGKVLVLNDIKVPELEEPPSISELEVETARKQLENVITESVWKQIDELAAAKLNTQIEQKIEIEVTKLDKEQRTQIHNLLKKLYNGRLVSSTAGAPPQQNADEANQAEDKKFIRIMKPKGGRGDKRSNWSLTGEYVHFLVHKENMDTSEVAVALADRLGLRPSQVNYCGTKDKRAKTTQKFCIKRRTPKQILGAFQFLRNAKVGNFEFCKEVLKLGNLKGNRFRIVLRHIDTTLREHIEASLKALQERGFINYYGLQRFGNCATVPTYEVGVALLKSDYKLACELILKPRDNDVHFLREIRTTWWEKRDSAGAAAMFRNDKFIEKKLLDGLAKFGENDYAGALRRIPRNMLLLYPHAYQSLIFNRVASRRIKEFGLKLIPGDLVYRNKEDAELEHEEEVDAVIEQNESETTDEAPNVDKTVDADNDAVNTTESIFKRMVKPLTEADIESGDYTIFDIVLPLPGFDVTYPANEVGLWYEQLLAESELSSEKLKHNVKTYALAGAYRKMLIKPADLKWHFRKYANNEDALIRSDWEELKNIALPKEPEADDGTAATALIMEFSLPTAAYATMLLRELLKQDTSAMQQTKLEQSIVGEQVDNKKEDNTNNSDTKVNEIAEKRKIEADKVEAKSVEAESETEGKKLKLNE